MSSNRTRARRRLTLPTALVPLAAALVASLATVTPAGAQPGLKSSPVVATSCPTDYNGATVPSCSTTTLPTVHVRIRIVLLLDYLAPGQATIVLSGGGKPVSGATPMSAGGRIDWQACGFPPAAAGLQVGFSIGGVLLAGAGGTGVVGPGGCTPDPVATVCLNPGVYSGSTNAVGYAPATASFEVTGTPSCNGAVGPADLTGVNSPAQSVGAPSGALAFTGANVMRLIAIALIVIIVGLGLARASRRRRRGPAPGSY